MAQWAKVIFWLAVAALVRGLFLVHPWADSDVATVGLMAKHLLEGEFSPLFWGQEYGGSIESLLAAPLFAVFGVNRAALNSAPLLISLFYLLGLFLFARELLGRRGALIALALAALGPFYQVWCAAQARGINMATLAWGTWLMWITARGLLRLEPGSHKYLANCLLFGLTAGLGLWTHMLAIYFIAPCGLLLWRRDPWIFLTPRILLIALGFIVGTAPLIYYNIVSDLGTWHYFFQLKLSEPFWDSNRYFFNEGLFVVSGLTLSGGASWLLPWGGWLLGLLTLGALALTIGRWIPSLWARLTRNQGDGGEIPLLVLLTVWLIFCLQGGGASHSPRYLVSLYSVWPLAMATACNWLLQRPRWGKKAGWTLAMVIGAFYLHGSLATNLIFLPMERAEQQRSLQWAHALSRFYQERDTRFVYENSYWRAARYTFDNQERVIFFMPHGDRYPGYLLQAIRTGKIAAMAPDYQLVSFLKPFHALGAEYAKEKSPPGFWSLSQVRPPSTRPMYLAPVGWRGKGSPSQEHLARAWDLNASTRWSTVAAQTPGHFVEIDLGRKVDRVCSLLIFSGIPQDKPEKLRLWGSRDGVNWQVIKEIGVMEMPWVWAGGVPVILDRAPWLELRFPPRSLRCLRLEQTGNTPYHYWSILEVLVGKDHLHPPPPPEPAKAAAWLAEELPRGAKVYAGPQLNAWLKSRLRPSLPRSKPVPDLREYLFPERLLPDEGPLYFALPLSLAPAGRRALEQSGWSVKEKRAHGYILFAAAKPGPQPPLRVIAARVRPRKDPKGLVVDLEQKRMVQGLILHGNAYNLLTPGELGLEASQDGRSFTPIKLSRLRWPTQLYWSGLLPLSAWPYPLRLEFAPFEAKFLRLVKTPPRDGALPDILKIDVLGGAPRERPTGLVSADVYRSTQPAFLWR